MSRMSLSTVVDTMPITQVRFREDPKQPHCYESIFKTDDTQAFIDQAVDIYAASKRRSKSFTLTVAIPSESGSLHGWRVHTLETPGRLVVLLDRG